MWSGAARHVNLRPRARKPDSGVITHPRTGCESVMATLAGCRLGAFLAGETDQVLVQLEPDRVVRVDARRGDVALVAATGELEGLSRGACDRSS